MKKKIILLIATFAVAFISCKKEVTLESIAVTTQPNKKEYFAGDKFDPAGMVVTATYSDKSTKTVTVTENMFEYDFSAVGTNKTVTITLVEKGKTATTTVTGITVNEAVLESIAVTTQPNKKEYFVGETFDPAGMVVTATYNSKTTKPVTVTASMLKYDFSEAGGGKTVTITYEGKTTEVTGITVIIATLESIAVTKHPDKKEYLLGDMFDPAGMVVTATYSNGSTSPVTITTAMLSYDFSSVGTNKTVTITYEGKPAIVTGITVNYPFVGNGIEGDPYLIGTPAQLAKLALLVNVGNSAYNGKHYKLIADIDLSDYGANYNSGKGWIPIGGRIGDYSNDRPFSGNFDGAGYKVSGLFINISSMSAGLFGFVNSGTIANLGITDVDIKGYNSVGGVTGMVWGNSNIKNCYVTGSVSGTNNVGGMVGTVNNLSSVTNSYFIGVVSSDWTSVGGVVGSIGGSMTNCYATGEVNGNGSVGGVAGLVWGDGSIENCYATSAISGRGSVGGVVGGINDRGSVTNCYATGAISGIGGVGGVAGNIMSNSSVMIQSVALNFSIMRTSGSETIFSRVAGIVAYTISNNVAWDGMQALGGITFSTGAHDNENGADITATQAKTASFWTTTTATWKGWDTTIWDISDGRLPILRNVGGNQTANNPPEHLR